MARKRRWPVEERLVPGVVVLAVAFVAVAAFSSVAVAVLATASESVEPPTVLIGGAPLDPTNQPASTFVFASSWAAATLECALDDDPFRRCTSPWHDTVAEGVRTFRVRALDLAGGRGPPARYTWTVDLTPPELTLPPDIVAEATGRDGAVVQYPPPSARDPSGIAGGPTCAPPSGTTFGLGTTLVRCSAMDGAGNTGRATFAVTVRDTRPPDLAGIPSSLTVESTGPEGARASWSPPSAVDRVSGQVPVTCSPDSGSLFPMGLNTVRCSAVDDAGNTTADSFAVRVRDTRAPTVTVPGPMTVQATGRDGAAVAFRVDARDEVGVVAGPTCRPSSGEVFPHGTTTVTCEALDAAGNRGEAAFTVTVVDTTPPVITPQVVGTEGNDGWFRSAVRVTWIVEDPESEITATRGCQSRTLTEDTGGITLGCSARSAGGTTTENVVVRIDRTPPGPTTARVDNARVITLVSGDAGSGLAAIHYQEVRLGSAPSGDAWVRYTEPFRERTCDAAIWARAEDRAGNLERPVRLVDTLPCIN